MEDNRRLKIGIIGISEGNGHPYSWSAIFNGYAASMRDCPYPVIYNYLSQHSFPAEGLGKYGTVTHIWTQDFEYSKSIADAANILNIVRQPTDMIPEVDAILLARDDAENHLKMTMPFIKAGLPIYIDKPFALSTKEANEMWNAQKFPNQIFTCSSLRYSSDLILSTEEKVSLGQILFVEASVVKKWERYGIHVIEPIVSQITARGKLLKVLPIKQNGISQVLIAWENVSAYIKATGDYIVPLQITFYGEHGQVTKVFRDSFSCFKASLKAFVETIHNPDSNIDREETAEIVKIIEWGTI